MSLNRSQDLREDGFEQVAVKAVALPHSVWKTDFSLLCDRRLKLTEQTVLALVQEGIVEPPEMCRLMGVDADVIVPETIVSLLIRGQLRYTDALTITALGIQALRDEMVRAERIYEDVWIRHDPYTDLFTWTYDDEVRGAKEVDRRQLHPLSNPKELSPLDVEIRHGEIQDLIDRFGLPKDNEQTKYGQRDLIRLKSHSNFVAYRPAELEVWHHPERDEWDWRLLYKGGEERQISDALRKMQAEGVEIIPLDKEPVPIEVSQAGKRVHEAVEAVTYQAEPQETASAGILQGAEHRNALKEAILSAERELIIVSPWLRTDAVDEELIGWLEAALKRQRELKIVVGYGIERDKGQQDRKAKDQRRALKRLNDLGNRQRKRLRTVEIGNTHEKVVLCDRQYAIVTSFNFLSFNPKLGRGIRREMGVLLHDQGKVKELRRQLAEDLRL